MKKNDTANRPFSSLSTRSFHAGGYSVAAAVIVLAIAVAVNALVGNLPSTYTKLDTTANGLYTVSEQTEKVLSGLDEDIDIYWIVRSGYEDSNIATLLDRYSSLSDKISVTKKDPDVYPTFAKQYYDGQLYNNSLVVCRGDRYRYIDYNSIYEYDYSDYYSGGSVSQNFAGEGELTSAISYVVNDAMPTLYILTGHGEAELSSTFKTAIEKQNIQTESLSLLTVEAVPEDAGALLINTPQSDISEDEAQKIADYLASGGTLVLRKAVQICQRVHRFAADRDVQNVLRDRLRVGFVLGRFRCGGYFLHLGAYFVHRPKGVLNQPLLAFVYDDHIAVVVQVVLHGKDGQHFGPVARPSMTVLVVVFHRGFAAFRVRRHNVVDRCAEVGIGFGNDFGNADAVRVAGFIGKQDAHRGADHRRSRAYDHRQQQHHAACAKQRHQRTGCAAYRARQHRFQAQPSSLQQRADSAQGGLPDTTGKSRDCIGQSDAAAKHRAARLLFQMAAHRFAREVLAFQRLHFVTVGIGRFDLPLIQRPLLKALALACFSLVGTLRQGGIFCFSGLGNMCGWHTLALFL